MNRSGYNVDEAGGILACSATGSQLMPPVMGAAAFMMATFIGQPYAVVMLAAILPAVLFYFAVAMGVQFLSVRKDLKTVQLDVDWGLIRRRVFIFIIPIGLIFAMLLLRYSPANTAFWASIVTLVAGFAVKDTRPAWKELIQSLVSGAVTGAKIGISLALIGMVAQTLISTGLGSKLASLIHMLAGGHLFIALVVTMIVSLILGCAVPPAAAYAPVRHHHHSHPDPMGVAPAAGTYVLFLLLHHRSGHAPGGSCLPGGHGHFRRQLRHHQRPRLPPVAERLHPALPDRVQSPVLP